MVQKRAKKKKGSRKKNPVTRTITMAEYKEPRYYYLGDKYGWLNWINTRYTWASEEARLNDEKPIEKFFEFENADGKRVVIDSKKLPENWHQRARWKRRSELIDQGVIHPSDAKVYPWSKGWKAKSASGHSSTALKLRHGSGRSTQSQRRFCPPGCIVSNPASAKTLIHNCQKIWEYYCARPSQKRLKEVFAHLEKMKLSKSKKVLEERRRCLRSANLEAKRLKMK